MATYFKRVFDCPDEGWTDQQYLKIYDSCPEDGKDNVRSATIQGKIRINDFNPAVGEMEIAFDQYTHKGSDLTDRFDPSTEAEFEAARLLAIEILQRM